MSIVSNQPRYQALDALRGLTIALMILVNTPGSWAYIYAPFQHADWHGCTPTDLVFPFFLCVVGAAMYFSFRPSGFSWSWPLGVKILRRFAIIFSLGIFLNTFPFNEPVAQWRIPGVLQRIALAYLLAAVVVLSFRRFGIIVISLVLLLGYWLVLWLYGGDQAYGLETNLVRQIDLLVLGENHLWLGKAIPFDPEGLLSTFPAVVNVLIGFEIARLITQQHSKTRALITIGVGGVTAILLGLLWNLFMPINKSLWTSSFVIYSAGYFALTLALFIWLIDLRGYRALAQPLIIYGTNPLFIYVLSILWVKIYYFIPWGEGGNFYEGLFSVLNQWISPLNASLVFAIIHVILFWFVSVILFKRHIFIKV